MGDLKMISCQRAAELLDMTSRRVLGLIQEEKLPGSLKIGRSWSIPEEEVLKYAKEHRPKNAKVRKMKTLLPPVVGKTSYKEIANDFYYVDKTLLIRDLIDDSCEVTLFTRPRRFGKTLALNMIKTYFEKSTEDTSAYFANKKIWKCGKKYRDLQGKYPLIYLTFKDLKYNTWEESLEAFKLLCKEEYKRHSELRDSVLLDEDDKDYYCRMIKMGLSNVEYSQALLNLSTMLAKHHNEKVVVLIDEYDTPIQQGYFYGFYNQMISFMRNLFSGGLKDNPNLAFGILSGILRVSKENLFSGLNNPAVNTVTDFKYSEYFGFTTDEVEEMAKYYNRTDKLEEMRDWYDGYLFGNTEIYNPWSVTSYFYNNCNPKAFWANTSDNKIIHEILENLNPALADEVRGLIQGDTVETFLNTEVIYPRLNDGNGTIFSFLLLAGYLKLVEPASETEDGTFCRLELPNKEVRRIFKVEILGWLKEKIQENVVSDVELALYKNDGNKLQVTLQRFMCNTISCFDGAMEGFYHGLMIGLTAMMSGKYLIRSNRESGDGRFDLQFEPKQKDLPGILMEFKAARSKEDDLVLLAEKGLRQIEEKNYVAELRSRGIHNITIYGIAFCGKQVEVSQKSYSSK